MSNSSEHLLRRMAEEWRLLASEIAGLAETAGHGRILDSATMIKLQAFDAVIQNIQCQSRLLDGLADKAPMLALLDDIPLPGVRARLKAAFGVAPAPRPAETGIVHLFANEADG